MALPRAITCLAAPNAKLLHEWASFAVKVSTPPDAPERRMGRGGPGEMLKPIFRAVKGTVWVQADHEKVAVAMQAWRGDGRIDGLTCEHSKAYIKKDHLARRLGVKVAGSKKKFGPTRWSHDAVIPVASLIKEHVASSFAGCSSLTCSRRSSRPSRWSSRRRWSEWRSSRRTRYDEAHHRA